MIRQLLRAMIVIAIASVVWTPVVLASPHAPERAPVAFEQSAAACTNPVLANLLDLINAYRANNGRQPLSVSSSLSGAAQHHADSMASFNYFDYTLTPENISFGQNIKNFGYPGSYIGEDIAAGLKSTDPATVLSQWEASPSQAENLLNPRFRAIGLGYAANSGADFVNYWVASLGDDVSDAVTCAATPAATIAATATSQPSATPTQTSTASPTATSTETPTATASATEAASASATASSTVTLVPTVPPTVTATTAPSDTPSTTETPSATATSTKTPSPSPTNSSTPTEPATPEPTATLTATARSTATSTPRPSAKAASQPTSTTEATATFTASPSTTATETATFAPTATATATATSTTAPTETPSATATTKPTSTATDTPAPTATPTSIATASETVTASATVTATETATSIPTETATLTESPTQTATSTETATQPSTPTTMPTEPSTPTSLPTMQPTSIPTLIPTTAVSPVASPSVSVPPASPIAGSPVSQASPVAAASPVSGAICSSSRAGAKAGQDVVVTCTGFGTGEQVNVYFDQVRDSALLDSFKADKHGDGSVTILAPEIPAGRFTIIAQGAKSDFTASVPLELRPAIYVTPKEGDPGDVISADLTGFQAGEAVTITWYDTETSVRLLRRVTVGEDGSLTTTFRAPGSSIGTHTIEAVGLNGASATTTYDLKST